MFSDIYRQECGAYLNTLKAIASSRAQPMELPPRCLKSNVLGVNSTALHRLHCEIYSIRVSAGHT
jgi:hypothetical protein